MTARRWDDDTPPVLPPLPAGCVLLAVFCLAVWATVVALVAWAITK